MKTRNYFSGTILLIMSIISLESCTKHQIQQADHTVFENDTTGDKVPYDMIIRYRIHNDRLYPYQTYEPRKSLANRKSIWDAEKKEFSKHEKIFKYFAAIIPAEYRRGIKYFSISDQLSKDQFAAMDQQKNFSLEQFYLSAIPGLMSFVDSIPDFKAPKFKFNTLGYGMATYAMIHEFGHYITLTNKQSYLVYSADQDIYGPRPKKGSFIDSINTITWRPYFKDEMFNSCLVALGSFYTCFPEGQFVSGYAGTNFNEDAAESFAHFVLLDNRPQPGTGANNKILLFYHDPQLVKLRQVIRENLKKMGIAPKVPNSQIGK